MAESYLFYTATESYAYTIGLFPKIIGGVTYTPAAIARSELQYAENIVKSQLTFNFPNTNLFAKAALSQLNDGQILVKVYKDESVFWVGRLLSVRLQGTTISLVCDSGYSTLYRQAAGARFSQTCWKNLYSTNCGVDPGLHTNAYPTYVIDNTTITVSTGAPVNHYVGGTAIIGNQVRRIIGNSDSVILISDAFYGVPVDTLQLRRGCALSRNACIGFNNLINFGGFSYMPEDNPMTQEGLL